MSRPPQAVTVESEQKTTAYRQVVAEHGIAALAARLDDALDQRSGAALALTEYERWERQLCRNQFGHFDPTSFTQRTWLARQADQHRDETVAAAA